MLSPFNKRLNMLLLNFLFCAFLLISIDCLKIETNKKSETTQKTLPTSVATPNSILNLPLTNLSNISQISSYFGFQYSYNQQTNYKNTSPNPNYFNFSNEGLIISIHQGDLKFTTSTDTFPRTELRGLQTIYDNVAYKISFDQYISSYPANYNFCWMQVFGATGPNVMLRYKNRYEIMATMGGEPNVKLPEI